MRTRLGALLVLALVTAVLVAFAPAGTARVASTKVSAAGYAAGALKATNNRRDAHEVRALRVGTCLERFATRQARRMAAQERVFHQDLGTVMESCGLGRAAENVAYGFRTGRATVKAWMHSEGHRANILDPGHRRVGIAARKDDDGDWYVSQVFGRKA